MELVSVPYEAERHKAEVTKEDRDDDIPLGREDIIVASFVSYPLDQPADLLVARQFDIYLGYLLIVSGTSPWEGHILYVHRFTFETVEEERGARSRNAHTVQRTTSLSLPTSPPVTRSVHSFGLGFKPASRRFDENQVFWNANIPYSDERVTSACTDWLDERALDARITFEKEEQAVRKKRDGEAKGQSAMTAQVFEDASKAARGLQRVVSQSGDVHALSEFNSLIQALGQLSAELHLKRNGRDEVPEAQLRATVATWAGWRAFDVATGNASLDDVRSFWDHHEAEKRVTSQNHELPAVFTGV
ncbi:hypothetical protein L198_01216 [Cryptococcus wingfieldii CBS 7118]|uniref:Uncharacterized protein n=1 Tax=Cryptococcus wingfieldii CBS 7118 TaxID=1295528 RepID=A0A1E3K3J6_9TREE|nr:hypothetical protein L198_01216 [Cryptococcus wingfieldii CBS 7118]ODO07635.1 hypothetical protein L198_01216 [Cryptococcus wingfieldii CBS 7118]